MMPHLESIMRSSVFNKFWCVEITVLHANSPRHPYKAEDPSSTSKENAKLINWLSAQLGIAPGSGTSHWGKGWGGWWSPSGWPSADCWLGLMTALESSPLQPTVSWLSKLLSMGFQAPVGEAEGFFLPGVSLLQHWATQAVLPRAGFKVPSWWSPLASSLTSPHPHHQSADCGPLATH